MKQAKSKEEVNVTVVGRVKIFADQYDVQQNSTSPGEDTPLNP